MNLELSKPNMAIHGYNDEEIVKMTKGVVLTDDEILELAEIVKNYVGCPTYDVLTKEFLERSYKL